MGKTHISIALLVVFSISLLAPLTIMKPMLQAQTAADEHKFTIADADWLDGWLYRKALNISGKPGAGTNYQIIVSIYSTEGVDSGSSIYTSGNCQADFGDIRFTASDGVTMLDYWMASSDSTHATFYVEISEDLDTDKTIYVYYGTKDETTTTSSPEDSLLFYDDFAASVVDWNKWASTSPNSYSISLNNTLEANTASTTEFIRTKSSFSDHVMVQFAVHASFKDNHYFIVSFEEDPSDWGTPAHTMFYSKGSPFDAALEINGTTSTKVPVSWDATIGARVIFKIDGANVEVSVRQGGNTWSANTTDAIYSGGDRYLKFLNLHGLFSAYLDDVIITKYVADGPTISSTGQEEANPSAVQPVGPSLDNPMFYVGVSGLVFLVAVVSIVVIKKVREGGESDRAFEIISPERSRTMSLPDDTLVESVAGASGAPRVFDTGASVASETIEVKSGFDAIGENLKLAVKVINNSNLIITDVQVILNPPDGFEFTKGSTNIQDLGDIPGHGFQSAIFWLKALRCVDSEYSGTVVYVDASGEQHVVKIPPKRLVNICPMLAAAKDTEEIFAKLKSGALARNCSAFEFTGSPQMVLKLAQARLVGLTPIDESEQRFEDDLYLGYAYYVGETKYGEYKFAIEIQVSGTSQGGVLTISVYSDDERILSGFFVDIMYDIRQHIEIIEEKMCPIASCPKCGANIDLSKIGENRVYRCEYCGTISKVAPWLN